MIVYHILISSHTVVLGRYRYDSRIWCISGSNFQNGQWRGDDYYFSRYNHCWGWASWRCCWQHYDSDLNPRPSPDSGLLGAIFDDFVEQPLAEYMVMFDNGKLDSWLIVGHSLV